MFLVFWLKYILCVCVLSSSVLSDSWWLKSSLPSSSVHGILQVRILEWVAMPFSRGISPIQGSNQVTDIAGRFFTIWATRKALSRPQTNCNSSYWLLRSLHGFNLQGQFYGPALSCKVGSACICYDLDTENSTQSRLRGKRHFFLAHILEKSREGLNSAVAVFMAETT